jgi:hypothetical protein
MELVSSRFAYPWLHVDLSTLDECPSCQGAPSPAPTPAPSPAPTVREAFDSNVNLSLEISHHIPYAHVASAPGRPYRRPHPCPYRRPHPCPDGVYRRCRDPCTCGCILNRTPFSTPACANADPHGRADACPHGACCPTRTCCSRAPRSRCVACAAAAGRFTARLMPRSRYLCPLRLPPRRRRRLPLRCVLPHPHALHICRIHPPADCLTVERHGSHLKHALPFSSTGRPDARANWDPNGMTLIVRGA